MKLMEQDPISAFIAGVAQMSLKPPSGINASVFHAKRLREIRNAARHILNNQMPELAAILASIEATALAERDAELAAKNEELARMRESLERAAMAPERRAQTDKEWGQ